MQENGIEASSGEISSCPMPKEANLKCEPIELVSRPKSLRSTAPNRDSGIFEDFNPPQSADRSTDPEEKVFEDYPADESSLREGSALSDSDRILHESLSSSVDKSEDDFSNQDNTSNLDSSEASANLDSDSEDSDLDSDSSSSSDCDLYQRSDPECDHSRSGYVSLWNEISPAPVELEQSLSLNKVTVEDNFEKYFYRKPISSDFASSAVPESFTFDPEESGDESYFDFTSASYRDPSTSCNPNEAPEESYFDFNLPSPDREDGLSSPGELSKCEDDFYSSPDEEDPSDIETKMAETKIKMNDAILSNGREDLAVLSLKLKQYQIKKGLIETNQTEFPFKETNNNNCKYLDEEKKEIVQDNTPVPDNKDSSSHEKRTREDSRSSSGTSADSPILDAYEKECQDAPEKISKDLEKGFDKKDVEKVNVELSEKETLEITKEKELEVFHDDVKTNEKHSAKKQEKVLIAEAEIHHETRPTFNAEDLAVRHRPSPKQRRRERNALRRSLPQNSLSNRDRNRISSPDIGEFDVYNMETAMPEIDWEAIEAHLKATKEEEKRRRTDREEIRRKLAMGTDEEFFSEKPIKKPSLHSRLQNGMNLQICFMNETASDCESQCSDTESTQDRVDEIEVLKGLEGEGKPTNFLSHQAKLQAEAHFALSQAKEMARMQMEIEKQNQKKSPIAEIVRDSFNKIGFPFPDGKRRMTRQILTDMNVAQLQVIVNDLHTQIENLNEDLVKMLLERDDLHMEQDSMLVDIEDLTKHLGAKQKNGQLGSQSLPSEMTALPDSILKNSNPPLLKPKTLRLKPLTKK